MKLRSRYGVCHWDRGTFKQLPGANCNALSAQNLIRSRILRDGDITVGERLRNWNLSPTISSVAGANGPSPAPMFLVPPPGPPHPPPTKKPEPLARLRLSLRGNAALQGVGVGGGAGSSDG